MSVSIAYSGYLVMVRLSKLHDVLLRTDLDISDLAQNRLAWPLQKRDPVKLPPMKPPPKRRGPKPADGVVAQHAKDLWGEEWRKVLSKKKNLERSTGEIQRSMKESGERSYSGRTTEDTLRRLINSGN
jgi:hypothetical protein